jgi:hypothetical protein
MDTPDFSGREIFGNYGFADALRVNPEVAFGQTITWAEYTAYSLRGLYPVCLGGASFDALLTYVRCIDDSDRPADHVGDWPVAGRWYLTRPVRTENSPYPGIRIVDFEGEAPYYNTFSHKRFDLRGPMPFLCLN